MKKGFTLVELVIVIVIVGILSIVAVPIYKGYVEKAKLTEGKALIGAIKTAQEIYYAEHGVWYTCTYTQYDPVLMIDARANKYFMWYTTNTSSNPGLWAANAYDERQANNNYVAVYWWNRDPATPNPTVGGYKVPVYFITVDGKRTYSQS